MTLNRFMAMYIAVLPFLRTRASFHFVLIGSGPFACHTHRRHPGAASARRVRAGPGRDPCTSTRAQRAAFCVEGGAAKCAVHVRTALPHINGKALRLPFMLTRPCTAGT